MGSPGTCNEGRGSSCMSGGQDCCPGRGCGLLLPALQMWLSGLVLPPTKGGIRELARLLCGSPPAAFPQLPTSFLLSFLLPPLPTATPVNPTRYFLWTLTPAGRKWWDLLLHAATQEGGMMEAASTSSHQMGEKRAGHCRRGAFGPDCELLCITQAHGPWRELDTGPYPTQPGLQCRVPSWPLPSNNSVLWKVAA